MLSKRIVAFDLDGTLTESKQAMVPEMAKLLLHLSGVVANIVVISGGSFGQFKKQLLSAEPDISQIITKHPNCIVLLPVNGTQRFEYDSAIGDWKMTDQEDFPMEIKQRVVEVLKTVEQSPEYEIPAEKFGERIEERGTQITFSALGQGAPLDKKKLWDPNQQKRQKIKYFLESQIDCINVAIGGMTSVDVLPKGFDKSVGLRRFLDKSGLSTDDMVFIGDAVFPGGNDYSPSKIGIETIAIASPAETMNVIEGFLK